MNNQQYLQNIHTLDVDSRNHPYPVGSEKEMIYELGLLQDLKRLSVINILNFTEEELTIIKQTLTRVEILLNYNQ